MHAAIYTGAGRLAVQAVTPAPPGPGEVVVEVAYTGICGTDLHVLHGDMDARVGDRTVLGHEMSGLVADVGPGVRGWAPGDAVTVLPVRPCGDCATCRAGHSHVCPRLRFLGIDADGSMQSRWTVPADALVAVPPGVELTEAAMVEPLAVAVHDVRRAGVRPGETALVVGGGPVGLLIALVARRAGAAVLVLEPNPHRRRVAEALGLRALDPLDREGADGADGVDLAFEVSGAQAGMDAAVGALSPCGRLVLVAIHGSPRSVDLHRFFWRELTLLGARLYGRRDFEEAVALVAAGELPLAALLSGVVPLGRVQEAFDALSGGDAVMKVLVDCRATTP